jgi:hypothetical protein
MNLGTVQGISIGRERDTGVGRRVEFCIVAGKESAALNCLLAALGPGDEVCLSDPRRDEGLVEVRQLGKGLELKRGQHGCAGTWQRVSSDEAFAALLEVAAWNLGPGEAGFALLRG